MRRAGFWSYDERTCQTSHSMPYCAVAKASDVPHWPAPVSVVSRVTPSWWLYQACGTAVFGLCEPAGLTPSYLKKIFAGVSSSFSSRRARTSGLGRQSR